MHRVRRTLTVAVSASVVTAGVLVGGLVGRARAGTSMSAGTAMGRTFTAVIAVAIMALAKGCGGGTAGGSGPATSYGDDRHGGDDGHGDDREDDRGALSGGHDAVAAAGTEGRHSDTADPVRQHRVHP